MKYGERARTFGQRLKMARKDAGLSRQDLADVIGITVNGFGLYETDLREPSLKTLVKIARRLHVSLDWLIGLTEDEQ